MVPLDTLANITQDEVEYARLCNLIKSELDYRTGMVEAKREGLTEGLREGFTKGHDEGRNEASLDIAQKMKNAGRPLSEITEFTGLSMETITQL